MKGVDQVVAWARAWLHAADEDRKVEILDAAGKTWRGALHKDWSLEAWKDLVGRVADLKSAFKQLPRHPAHACFSIVAVARPGGEVVLFEALSMMFGQTAAVTWGSLVSVSFCVHLVEHSRHVHR